MNLDEAVSLLNGDARDSMEEEEQAASSSLTARLDWFAAQAECREWYAAGPIMAEAAARIRELERLQPAAGQPVVEKIPDKALELFEQLRGHVYRQRDELKLKEQQMDLMLDHLRAYRRAHEEGGIGMLNRGVILHYRNIATQARRKYMELVATVTAGARASQTPEQAREYLVFQLGTHNPDGTLTKEYGGEYTTIPPEEREEAYRRHRAVDKQSAA